MNAGNILLLFDYNDWAALRILNAAVQVAPEQFVAPNTSSYGNLRGTLTHTLSAGITWRKRLQGLPASPAPLAENRFPDPQGLLDAWVAEHQLMCVYLAGLEDADLDAVIEYKTSKGIVYRNVLWGILVHLINHGTQHLAEAAAMLTDFNHSPGDIDLIVYLRERGI
jgi:uncharacterized damage-inducible protein DinB